MLAFKPIRSKLDFPDMPGVLYSVGPVSVLRFTESEGPSSLRIRNDRFILFSGIPGSTVAYTRHFLLLKADMLRSEWARRHRYFQRVSADGTSDFLYCADGCPLSQVKGHHCKLEEEEMWEKAAADAYTSYVSRLNHLMRLERKGHVIMGMTDSDNPKFDAYSVPKSLFSLPHVSGSTFPPSGRIDPNIPPDLETSALSASGPQVKLLLAEVEQFFSHERRAMIATLREREQQRVEDGRAFGFLATVRSLLPFRRQLL